MKKYNSSTQNLSLTEKYLGRSNGLPFQVKRGKGAYLYDFDGHRFLDFALSEGSLLLGHAHPAVTKVIKNAVSRGYVYSQSCPVEYRLAKSILDCYPGYDGIRFHDSKNDTLKELIRAVKKLSGKETVLFIGEKYQRESLEGMETLSQFDLNRIDEALTLCQGRIGGICLEPVSSSPGLVIHEDSFFRGIEEIRKRHDLVFVLDEEHSGFRLALGGGREYYGLTPDLVVLGRVIGGGFPLYAVAGERGSFETECPTGYEIYQPTHYAAGLETIRILRRENPYIELDRMVRGFCDYLGKREISARGLVSLVSVDLSPWSHWFTRFLNGNYFFNPSGRDCHYLSICHNSGDMMRLARFICRGLET